jgi:hypothetical protein
VIPITHTTHIRSYAELVTISRLISFPLHGALEIALGALIMAAPFALGLSVSATITAVVLGALIFGLGASATDTGERGTLPVSAHADYDAGMALGLAVVGLVFGIAGYWPALAFFALAAIAQLGLASITRYSPSPAR